MAGIFAPVNWMLEALMISDSAAAPVVEVQDRLNWAMVARQDSVCTNKIIEVLGQHEAFQRVSLDERHMLVERDNEDNVKLLAGVAHSIARGVLTPIQPPSVSHIDVKGKSPQEVADLIIRQLPRSGTDGCVVVLQGQSGTGKGTTTATLLERLPNSVSWSNGNIFRSLTLLAATHCKNEGIDLAAESEKVLTPENVAKWVGMLRFERVGDKKYDAIIEGLGINARVSEVQNTLLKEPIVAKNIPTVAEQTQGDVVLFASKALEQMAADGMNVVLEGRAATVQYIATPYRFELIMDDVAVLGDRRAAQRIMAAIHMKYKDVNPPTRQRILHDAKALCEEWASTRI